jgi:hypothetical protein
MLTSDTLRNLRAGPVISAGRMNDATIRTWVANFGLKLGDREGREAGNPRYDLADGARVFMLHLLTKQARMAAEPAVWVVNHASAHLALIAEYELRGIDNPAQPPECPRYILTLPASAFTVETNPEIRLFSDPGAIADRESNRGRWLEIVMDLREIVRAARDNLLSQLGHSTAGLRHDFADAPAV